jgi:hypothetical protein
MIIEKLKAFFYIALAALVLMIPALYNGYPLVYPDTGTYIKSGMELSIPLDRPVMYGLFIRLVSLQISLWPVIVVQCLLLAYVMSLCYKIFSDSKRAGNAFIFIVSFLTAFTGVGWYAGQLMPDIYTPVAVMCGLLLMFYKRLSLSQRILVSLILIFSESVHFSNFAICFLLLIFLFCLVRTKLIPGAVIKEIRFLWYSSVLVCGIMVSSLVNYSIGSTFRINQGSHVFLIGKMLDNGILEKFLDEKCGETNYILCGCKNKLPADSRALLWDSESPLYKQGGWKETSWYYNQVLKGIFTSPKYMGLFLYHSILSGFSQLFQNEIGSGLGGNFNDDPASPAAYQVSLHFPQERNPYHQSRQNGNLWGQSLDFKQINDIYYPLLTITAMFLLFIVLVKQLWNALNDLSKLLFIALASGAVINAFVTGALANVYDRLQGRVSWMFLFIAFMILLNERKMLVRWVREKINTVNEVSGNL